MVTVRSPSARQLNGENTDKATHTKIETKNFFKTLSFIISLVQAAIFPPLAETSATVSAPNLRYLR